MCRMRRDHGLSLVEVTIILMALTVMTSVLAPSVEDYISSARDFRVKEDCEAIGLSIARLSRDIGPCLRINGNLPCSVQNRVDLLISGGQPAAGYAGAAGSWYGTTHTAAWSDSSASSSSSITRAGAVTSREVTDYVIREAAAGTTWTEATHLGGSTAFYAALTSAADLKRMAAAAGLADDIRRVLAESGLAGAADAAIKALSEAASEPGASLPSCTSLSPPEGEVVECQVEPGSTMEWMAYRPGAAKGNRTPSRLQHVRWAGKAPFRAFLFRVEAERESYTFVVPFPCANLALLSVADIRQRTMMVQSEPVTTSTSASSHSSSYQQETSRSSGWYSNMNAAIGWFSTPLHAGLPYAHPNVDYLENHLIWNRPSGSATYGYRTLSQVDYTYPGPQFNLGWRGAYLSAPITGDPWGHRYLVNTMFLYARGTNPGVEGYRGWHSNTFCLSAGPDGIIETPFASYYGNDSIGIGLGPGHGGRFGNTVREGDDFVYVIAGGSR